MLEKSVPQQGGPLQLGVIRSAAVALWQQSVGDERAGGVGLLDVWMHRLGLQLMLACN